MKVVREVRLNLSPAQELQVAYYFVFFGIGQNSMVSAIQALKLSGIDIADDDLTTLYIGLDRERFVSDNYFGLDGHQVRLGHYYRHLFQSVAYAHEQPSFVEKYSYIKTLRAQLSTYEQILLLVNSLTPLGWEWHNRGFIKDYGLVKNIPLGMLEQYCGISIGDMFGEKYWEYADPAERPTFLNKVRIAQGG